MRYIFLVQNFITAVTEAYRVLRLKQVITLEAKDVLPNINRTQAAERAEKCRFCPW